MALRLPVSNFRLLAALLLAPAAAGAAPAEPGLGAGHATAASTDWRERVQIRSGAGSTHDRPTGFALRIITAADDDGAGVPQERRRADPPGRSVDGHPSPATTAMPARAEALLAEYFANFPDAVPAERGSLQFMAHEWALIQRGDRDETAEYRLDHLSFIEQRRADGTYVDAVSCSDGERSATLEQWQANDHALLRQASASIAEACVARLSTRLPAFYPSALAREALGSEPVEVVPAARVRIFGATGRGITLYTDATCNGTHRDVIEVSRSNFRALGSLFGGAPENVVIGIPETDTVRGMTSVLFSKPHYEEYEVPGGKPLRFEARIENTADYRCARTLSAWFVATPGMDYEVEMDIADRMCRLQVRRVRADGSLAAQPVRPGPMRCEHPGRADGPDPLQAGPPVLP